jgi:hypothetical protein
VQPVRSATQILFKIAAGELLGPDQPVILQLGRDPTSHDGHWDGVVMELIELRISRYWLESPTHDNPASGFQDADVPVFDRSHVHLNRAWNPRIF